MSNGGGSFGERGEAEFAENQNQLATENAPPSKGYYSPSAANGQRPMPIEIPASHRLSVPLVHWVGDDASAEQIAAALVEIWQGINVALTPVIGPLGLAALYRRSLHLTVASHAWLAVGGSGAVPDKDFTALTALIAQRSSVDAAAAATAFLNKFHEVLISLIGPSLTERLLRSVWAHTSSGQPAQDHSL
jgi:hypothetical protein